MNSPQYDSEAAPVLILQGLDDACSFSISRRTETENPQVEPLSPAPPPMPFDSAVLMAAFQRDEVARLDLSGIDGDATFLQNDERLQQLKGELDEIQLEFADYAAAGFALAAILDVITATDGAIYKTLAGLIEAGTLSVR